jgi:hypothetical protein
MIAGMALVRKPPLTSSRMVAAWAKLSINNDAGTTARAGK